LILALTLTACPAGVSLDDPPEVVIVGTEITLRLRPLSFCWNTGRAGFCIGEDLPDPLPHLGLVEGQVDVEWPFDSWDFNAVLTDPLNRDEDERVTVELIDLGNNVWAFEPAGLDGQFEVELFGIGPEGDVYVAFTADFVDQPDLRAPLPFFSFLA
jgi:hypothetical protein